MVEDFSLRRIGRRFRFCYHWRAIDTALIRGQQFAPGEEVGSGCKNREESEK